MLAINLGKKGCLGVREGYKLLIYLFIYLYPCYICISAFPVDAGSRTLPWTPQKL